MTAVKRKSCLRISYSEIKAFLLIFPFIEVHVFNVGQVYDLAITAAIIYVLYIIYAKRIIFRKKYFFLLAYTIWLAFSCYLNGRSIFPGLFYGFKLLAFTQIIEFAIQQKNNVFFEVTKKYMVFLLVISTVFQYINQDLFGHLEMSGNYNNFAFGDNYTGYYYIPLIALCFVDDFKNRKKISLYTYIIITFVLLSLFKAWSAKAIVGILMIIGYTLFLYGKRISKLFNLWFVIITYAVLEIGIVIFNVQNHFSYLIETLLHKDVSLTGRVALWANVVKNIASSFIYGHGIMRGGYIYINATLYGADIHAAHNFILEILMQTGIVGLILFLSYIIVSLYQKNILSKANKNIYYMLMFFVYVLLIMQIASGQIYLAFQYLPLILCANIDKLFGENIT